LKWQIHIFPIFSLVFLMMLMVLIAPDFFLKVFMFNMQEIWSFDSQKNY